MLHTVLLIIQLFCAIGIVALVLLQRGKGADAGAGFGAGASGTVFGARGATTALSRATAILAALFMLTSLTLGYLSSHGGATPASNSSLLDRLSQQPAAAPAVTPAPRSAAPAAAPAASSGGAVAPEGSASPATPATSGAPGATSATGAAPPAVPGGAH
ncbi:MAG TPA: preprotein translocase subunit SecG [Steroidobacteraceae bacterium]|nr:preprotein translocase subunit SecG [Steroidobacteraceae bacterium]